MDSVLDLFLGDRVYDENGKLIKRDFGIKNILAIAVVVFLGYSLMGKSFSVPTLSGKKKGKKMKGGAGHPTTSTWDDFIELVVFIIFLIILPVAAVVGMAYAIDTETKSIGAVVGGVIFLAAFVYFVFFTEPT